MIENPSDLSTGNWIETTNSYDDKGRLIQTNTQNYKNGTDITTMRYDFTGKVITSYQVHNNAAAGQTVKVKTNMLYDHAGRLLTVKKTLNDNSNTTRYLARNEYDELGQLTQKSIGQKGLGDETAMEVSDNSYNIRGWLQGVNKGYSGGTGTKWFGMELNYDHGFVNKQYNGNIAGMQWRSRGDGERRAMGYGYDAANRILKGEFTQYTSSTWNNNAGLNFSLDTMTYDANGNIYSMVQKGWKISGSERIDSLLYTYNPNSNKLLNVIDGRNETTTQLGDFRSSAAYISALGTKTNAAIDYTYDNNGNLLKDRNKDIGNAGTSGITYNHLNLPYKVWVSGKGTITYIYDAAGNKLEKRTYDSTISKATRTTYLGGYVYQNDTLQFLGHEEGRIRKKPDHSFVYDYFIKDHLGNTRMVLTEEYEQNTYPVVTLEDGATATEGGYYNINTGNIADKGTVTNFNAATGSGYKNNNGNPPYNTNPSSVVTATSNKLYKLNGNTGDKTGLGITLKVMSGDTVSIYNHSYWHNSSAPTNSYPLVVNDLLTALSGTNAVAAANKGATSGALTGSSVIPGDITSWLTTAPSAGSGPKAYTNWILFDEQFRVVTASSGFHKVSGTSDVIDSFGTAVNIVRNGYLYVYCSNESNTDVFFDNLQVIHNKGPLLEETHYYPFGLTMAGISSKAAGKLENRIKYNNMELQSGEFSGGVGLEMYEYKYRFYDHQIGRFISQDLLASKYPHYAPYQFAGNEVPNAIDQDGLEPAYTVIKGRDIQYVPAGDNLKRPIPSSHQADFNRSMGGTPKSGGIGNPLVLTDVNDATVLTTWMTRGSNAINIDGSEATSSDKGWAVAGALIPFVSGSAIKRMGKALFKSGGSPVLEGVFKKIGNINKALDEKHIQAAVGDIMGNPVVINGKTYDHLTEVQDALRGMGTQIDKLNNLIASGDLSGELLKSTEVLRSSLQNRKDAITDVLNNARKKASEQ